MPRGPAGGTSKPLIALFDRVADSYDRIGPAFFQLFAELLVKSARVPPRARVLDLATGRGAVLLSAAHAAGDGGRLIGVDLSMGMLRQAAKEIRRGGRGDVHLQRMDASALAFADRRFDRVLCGFALDLCDDPASVLAESHRVLVPGGLLALTVWASDCPYFLWLARSLDACQSQLKIRPQPSRAPVKTRPGLLALLQNTGFGALRVECVEQTVAYGDPERWWDSLWTHCPRGILERFHPRTLKRVKPCLMQRAESLMRDGAIMAELRAYLALGVRRTED